jgi:threonine dehydrogenase-like Zn-dependent dehydrogenase
VLRRRGDTVTAVDPRAARLARARELGAEADGRPASAAVVTAPAGVNDALGGLEPGGTLLLFAASAEEAPVALDVVYRNELRVVGSRSATPSSFRSAVELLPALELPDVTTLPLEQFADGVELYRRGEATKIVFTP